MSMHLEKPYITTTKYSSKRKKSKNKALIKAKQEHEAWLEKMGVGKSKHSLYNKHGQRIGINEIPDYKVDRVTSDTIPGNGTAQDRKQYTGNEIAGIVTTHKSNLMPIRRDNKNAAKDAASMRR